MFMKCGRRRGGEASKRKKGKRKGVWREAREAGRGEQSRLAYGLSRLCVSDRERSVELLLQRVTELDKSVSGLQLHLLKKKKTIQTCRIQLCAKPSSPRTCLKLTCDQGFFFLLGKGEKRTFYPRLQKDRLIADWVRARARGSAVTRARQRGVIGRSVPVSNAAKKLITTFSFSTISLGNMPPDSKDLSSLKEKSSSYHRLQTADFEGMKGRYLTPEELKGFDKYKVSLSSLRLFEF